MITKLHELPTDHKLRNTGARRDPRSWKIGGDTYNRLGDTWRTNFDWILKP